MENFRRRIIALAQKAKKWWDERTVWRDKDVWKE